MSYLPWLGGVTLVAATVNGALGYGFSSLTVPLALLAIPNRILNPSLVLVEVGLNLSVVITNRRAVPAVWRGVLPVIGGLVPGILAGTAVLLWADPAPLKVATFAMLAPLVLIQAAGFRRPVRGGRALVPAGAGVGVLYAVTTISGPPLAVLLTNQGLANAEFRAAIGMIRLVESTLTALAYGAAGLLTSASLALMATILPSLAIGVPLGTWLFRRVPQDVFRRVCLSFDAWIVAFGLASVLQSVGGAGAASAACVAAVIVGTDVLLLLRFVRARPTHLTAAHRKLIASEGALYRSQAPREPRQEHP